MRRIFWILLLALPWASMARAQTEEAMLDTIQHRAFGFFWSEVNPANGLIRDRSQSGSPCSIASLGFGLSAICVGIDRGWVTRAAGRDRVHTALQTLWNGPQGTATTGMMGYKGLYYHFLNMNTGLRMPVWNPELSTIDTALLFAGVIDVKEYFTDPGDPIEVSIRALADSIYYRADWEWARNFQTGIEMGWKPGAEGGFGPFGLWVGYNEAMILYILALGSPTHPIGTNGWSYWTSNYNYSTQFGQTYVIFPPLFGHQYSHCWIDYRNIDDAYMRARGLTYFENSRRATLAQRSYAIAKGIATPTYGYTDSLWGLTASDTPTGYRARGAPPAQDDDGTITPTAPFGSLPFAPEACLPVAWKLWYSYRNSALWGPYGYRDAFNLNVDPDWYDPDYIGIDQGPIVLMIENYRTGSVWQRFMNNVDVHRGLVQAGFLPLVATVPEPPGDGVKLAAEPNPFTDRITLRFHLGAAGPVRLTLHDLQGREVARALDEVRGAGPHSAELAPSGLPSGVYHARLVTAAGTWTRRCVLVR